MVSKFTIGQRVRVVRLGDWNGTPPDEKIRWCIRKEGVVKEVNGDSTGVKMDVFPDYGVLQFLCNELEAIGVDESSGGE